MYLADVVKLPNNDCCLDIRFADLVPWCENIVHSDSRLDPFAVFSGVVLRLGDLGARGL